MKGAPLVIVDSGSLVRCEHFRYECMFVNIHNLYVTATISLKKKKDMSEQNYAKQKFFMSNATNRNEIKVDFFFK